MLSCALFFLLWGRGVDVLQTVVCVLLLKFCRLTWPASQKVAVDATSLLTLLYAPFLALVYFQAVGGSNLCPITNAVLELASCCSCRSLSMLNIDIVVCSFPVFVTGLSADEPSSAPALAGSVGVLFIKLHYSFQMANIVTLTGGRDSGSANGSQIRGPGHWQPTLRHWLVVNFILGNGYCLHHLNYIAS